MSIYVKPTWNQHVQKWMDLAKGNGDAFFKKQTEMRCAMLKSGESKIVPESLTLRWKLAKGKYDISDFVHAVQDFYDKRGKDKTDRFRSWEHCYKVFADARRIRRNGKVPDYDYLCLHLAFYLASWGMYRGSSFLLQQDYKVHRKAVRAILRPEYDPLWNIECLLLGKDDCWNLLDRLYRKLRDIYTKIREKVVSNGYIDRSKGRDASDVLITKIMMGTLGCTPAYDTYFISGIKAWGKATQNFNCNSIRLLTAFYEENRAVLEQERARLRFSGYDYPQMKLIDMGFWMLGFNLDNERKNQQKQT